MVKNLYLLVLLTDLDKRVGSLKGFGGE